MPSIKEKNDNIDEDYFDFSAFKGKTTEIQKHQKLVNNVNIPKRINNNVANLNAAKRELEHRKFVEHKNKILRRRRIILVSFFLVVLLIFTGIVSLIIGMFKNKPTKDNSTSKLLDEEIAFIDKFLNSDKIYYTENNNETINLLENMLKTYTLVNDGKNAVKKSINEASYFEWDAKKYVWLSDKSYIADLKNYLKEVGISQEGYIWSSSESSKNPKTGSYFYDTNVKFVSAVCEICLWETSDEFLYSMDSTSKGALDFSSGKTVGEKMQMAIDYVINTQYNKNEKIIYDKDSRSFGTMYGASSNYWYNYRFGNADAYNNIYFYNALNKLYNLYKTNYLYDEKKAETYRLLAIDVKDGFQIFWDNDKGRFIGAIDTLGEKHDYGFVFLNLEAIYYGLADENQSLKIFSWIDGKRIIEGDTSTGNDIYYFGFSPRTTTKSADNKWWNSIDDSLRTSENADFGKYYQNGGASLLLSYYDIMARFKTNGLENAMPIMKMMLTEYERDGLLKNSADDGLPDVCATNIDYPESGLAPCIYVYGMFGLSTDGMVLNIDPNFPAGIGSIGIKKFSFANNIFSILNNDFTTYIFAESSSSVRIRLGGFAPNSKVKYIYYENNKPIYEKELIANEEGFVYREDQIGKNSFAKFDLG